MSKTLDAFVESRGRDSGAAYVFEDANLPAEKIDAIKTEQLIHRLRKVVANVQGVKKTSSYDEERRTYVALNKALNEKGSIAPRFRPSLSAGSWRSGERDEIANMISNDHQVLDLHWLSTQCGLDRLHDAHLPPRWQGLFDDELDLEIAATFAGTAGTAANKVGILGLSSCDQLQLRTIQSDAIRKAWQRMRQERDDMRATVIASARSTPGLRGKEDKWSNGWLALKCAEVGGLSAALWYEMITGQTIPASTLSNIKRRGARLRGK